MTTWPGGESPGFSRVVLGHAAQRVLDGDITEATVTIAINGCRSCATRPCWHAAAKMLIQHGLQPDPNLIPVDLDEAPMPAIF